MTLELLSNCLIDSMSNIFDPIYKIYRDPLSNICSTLLLSYMNKIFRKYLALFNSLPALALFLFETLEGISGF